ncbi:MAG: VCBS domain-containing protein, partial [Rhodoferax sp.]|nr:VCBS domain-containing protein [Rhodoferax sp.]
GKADVLYGGAGADTLWGDTSATLVLTAEQNALMWADDYLDGEDGDDQMVGGGGADTLYGGLGNDNLIGDENSAALDAQYQGADYLDGEDGNDQLIGGGAADTLFGGAGDDVMLGDAQPGELAGDGHGSDYLDGEDGDDQMVGGGGADTLYGGTGNDLMLGDSNGADLAAQFHGDDYLDGEDGDDLLIGDGGRDTLIGGTGNDQLQGGADDDQLQGGDGGDVLLGEGGNDTLFGAEGNDQLAGGQGDDLLDGGEGTNWLWGEQGNDTLQGGAGTDYLSGGMGDDVLAGGGGDDIYYYNPGEGTDRITDSGGTDWVVFTNVVSGDVEIGVGSLKITLPDGGSIHLDDFDPDNPLEGAIEWFQFSDQVLSRQALIEMHGFKIRGTPGDDNLTGTALADRIDALDGADVVSAGRGDDTVDLGAGDDWVDAGQGNDTVLAGDGNDWLSGDAGDDQLQGDAGNDFLSGGTGTDLLQGGDGDDSYGFGRGDGQDTVIDTAGANSVQLAGLSESGVLLSRSGMDLLVAVVGAEDCLTVKDWFAATGSGWTLSLGDGTRWDRAAVDERMVRNQPPVLAPDLITVTEDGLVQASGNALANDSDPDGLALRVTNPGTYAGAMGSLSIQASGAFSYALNNGSAQVQALAAGQRLTESYAYTASDDDPAGAATASSAIVVTIQGTNDAPVVAADSAWVSEDGVLSASGNVLANDHDVDAGTTLRVNSPGAYAGSYGSLSLAADGSYTYALANGSAAVQSLGRGQQVTDRFSYAATDGLASAAATTLQVTVQGRNDAPVLSVALPDQLSAPNKAYSWPVPVGSFTDVDAGDTLGYTASLADGSALPTWLSFDSATRTFAGRVPRTATGFLDIKLVATDRAAGSADTSASLSASDVFRLSFDAAAGGGGGGGGSGTNGNEGVGNGVDAPPPRHDSSFNDGEGTGPGNPGAKGGNGLALCQLNAPVKRNVEAISLLAAGATAPVARQVGGDRLDAVGAEQGNMPASTPGHSPSSSNQSLAPSTSNSNGQSSERQLESASAESGPGPASQDSRLGTVSDTAAALRTPLSIESEPWARGADKAIENSFWVRWAHLDEQLALHLAGSGDGADANAEGAGPLTPATMAGNSLWAQDPITAGGGNSNQLKIFQGLQEGLRSVGNR